MLSPAFYMFPLFTTRCLNVRHDVIDPSGGSGNCGRECCPVILPKWRLPRHLGIFYMPQIYDMGPKALLPLRRKACWGFFEGIDARIINLRAGIMWSASCSCGKNAGAHWLGGYSYNYTGLHKYITKWKKPQLQLVTVCTLHDPSGYYLISSCSYCRWCLNLAARQQLHSEQKLMSSTLWHKGHSYLTTLSIVTNITKNRK